MWSFILYLNCYVRGCPEYIIAGLEGGQEKNCGRSFKTPSLANELNFLTIAQKAYTPAGKPRRERSVNLQKGESLSPASDLVVFGKIKQGRAMDYTKKVSEFVAQTTYRDLPAKAIELAKQAVLDAVGVTLGTASSLPAKFAHKSRGRRARIKIRAFFNRGSKPLLLRLLWLMGRRVMRWTMIITSSTWVNPRPVWLRPSLRLRRSWEKAGGIFGSIRHWFRSHNKVGVFHSGSFKQRRLA